MQSSTTTMYLLILSLMGFASKLKNFSQGPSSSSCNQLARTVVAFISLSSPNRLHSSSKGSPVLSFAFFSSFLSSFFSSFFSDLSFFCFMLSKCLVRSFYVLFSWFSIRCECLGFYRPDLHTTTSNSCWFVLPGVESLRSSISSCTFSLSNDSIWA